MATRFYVENYEQLDKKGKEKTRTKFVCPMCGEWVNYWQDKEGRVYLACHQHDSNKHEGVTKEFTPPNENLITARRETMSQEEIGTSQALVARGIPLTGVINKEQATAILNTIWPGAPEVEVYKAAMLCNDCGLHPLLKHVFLVKYDKYKDGKKIGETWSTVLGIGATRLMMSRQGTFSYTDDTPRIMSKEEQTRIFGKVDAENIVAITKLRTRSGEEASGYGKYPKTGGHLMGEDKGNSRENMAFIRSERNAFGRLFPDAKMPTNVEVVDEQYMETPSGTVDKETGEIVEGEFSESPDNRGEFEKEGRDVLKETLDKPTKKQPEASPSEPQQVLHPQEGQKDGKGLKRDPASLETITDMYKACHADYGLQPKQVMAELNVNAWTDLTLTPAEAYLQIAAARG